MIAEKLLRGESAGYFGQQRTKMQCGGMGNVDSYVLKFADDDGTDGSVDVAFTAADVSEALVIARSQASHRNTELWKDGHRLCALPAHVLPHLRREIA